MITVHARDQKEVELKDLSLCAEHVRSAVWIDLHEPTREEELAVESALGIDIPTRREMEKLELSSRLYREKDSLFMTVTVLTRADTSHPESSPVTFILTPTCLVTLRYVLSSPFKLFDAHRSQNLAEYDTPPKIFVGLVEAIAQRLADILERTGDTLDKLSLEIFSDGVVERTEPEKSFQTTFPQKVPTSHLHTRWVLRRIGRYSDLSSRSRESLVSLGRLVSFFGQVHKDSALLQEALNHLRTVGTDLQSLSDHASFLSGKVAFLLDATLGHINNEQNGIIKIVSVAALVFLPPTLVASIYGMNFHHMPELEWRLGYPLAVAMMVISAVMPYVYFKRKGWL